MHKQARAFIWVGLRCIDAIMIVLFVAALSKGIDIQEFEVSLRTWDFIPGPLTSPLSMLIPALELSIAFLWFLRLSRKWAAVMAFVMLAAFTATYALHLAFASPPDCGCFALIEHFYSQYDAAHIVLIRNGIMLAILAIGFGLITLPQRLAAREPRRTPDRPDGFTLIETLVSIAVIVILLGLIVPAIWSAKEASKDTVSLANLRSHAQVLATYGNEWEGAFPYFTDPKLERTPIKLRGKIENVDYFAAHAVWSLVLAENGYYDGNHHHSSFYNPKDLDIKGNRITSGTSSYLYPCAFIASSRFWNPSTRTGPEQRRMTRQSSVRYTNEKAVLVEGTVKYPYDPPKVQWRDPSVRAGMAFADGSAEAYALDKISVGYEMGDGLYPGFVHLIDWPFGLHTIDGVRGRDVAR